MSAPPPNLEEMKEALGHPLLYPQEFKDYISDYVATHLNSLPLTQVYGFHIERYRQDVIATQQGTNSTSYTDLATVGPTLTEVPDGLYLIIVGCHMRPQTVYADIAMSFSVDGAAASDDNAAWGNHPGSNVKVSLVDLRSATPEHQHTIQAKYKNPSGVNNHLFSNRFLIAVKVVSGVQ